MKRFKIILGFFLYALTIASAVYADGPDWVMFDPDYPKDFIDAKSITSPEKGIVRFWERAGNRKEKNTNGEETFAQYTLSEINCILKQGRDITWDRALEDQNTVEGVQARAKFLGATVEQQKFYPTQWESIEPNKHNYARYNFVCKGMQTK
jgi:hypothetical protein